jgi:hypothetical protein
MIRDLSGKTPGTVIYVEHWFEELEAKLRAKH